MKKHIISYSQKEAGFKVETREHILLVDLEPTTYKIASRLKKDLVVEGTDEVILADTPVKLMMKLHQLYSGTIKFESGNSKVIDYSKANYIHYKYLNLSDLSKYTINSWSWYEFSLGFLPDHSIFPFRSFTFA